MAYKVSVTRITVTGDSADEIRAICNHLAAHPPIQGECYSEPTPIFAPPADSKAVSLEGAIHTYLIAAEAAGHAPRTLDLHRSILGAFQASTGGERDIDSIDEAAITAYLHTLRARQLTEGYVYMQSKVLKRFFNTLLQRGSLETSPMAALQLRAPPRRPVPPFSDGEIDRLLKAVRGPMDYAVLVLLLDTGMRASELAGLTIGNLDLERGLIRVAGKGGKQRTLALNERPREALEAYLLSRRQQNEPVWPDGWNRHSLGTLIATLGRRAGVPKTFPHRFRHTFATRFMKETGNALALQALLGHSSLAMVQRYIAAAQADMAVVAHKEHSPIAALL